MKELIKKLTDDNFTEIVSKNGLVLVDFFAEWCGPCKMLAPVLEKLASEMLDTVTVAKLDIDHAQKTTADFQITSVPTLILFKDGKEVQRVVGLKNEETLKRLIQSVQ